MQHPTPFPRYRRRIHGIKLLARPPRLQTHGQKVKDGKRQILQRSHSGGYDISNESIAKGNLVEGCADGETYNGVECLASLPGEGYHEDGSDE